MKLSIVIPVLNSHEVLRRQILHWETIGVPDDTEIIIVDDGSDPPLQSNTKLPLTILGTNDFRPWTWALARNAGAKVAKGEFLIMVDLDHIISGGLIDCVRGFDGDHVRFNREFAILTEDGVFTQDMDTLVGYGWPEERSATKGLKLSPHRNQFAIRKDLFWELGGYVEDRVGLPYPQGEDGVFSKKWDVRYEEGKIRDFDDLVGFDHRPTLYMFPNGKFCGDVDHNPHNLFHTLTRKTRRNPNHRQELHG